MELYTAMKHRRTRYAICEKSPISDEQLEQILRDAVQYTPSAFHSQTSRGILLLGEEHKALWNIVMETLRARVPADRFGVTETKINSFAAGHGTILYFEDMDVVKELQETFATYKDNFPIWSNQSSGMLQYAVWTALSAEGLGVSIQHYNPLIDDEVKERYQLPNNWKLIAQMPFGLPTAEPDPLQYKDLQSRVIVKK